MSESGGAKWILGLAGIGVVVAVGLLLLPEEEAPTDPPTPSQLGEGRGDAPAESGRSRAAARRGSVGGGVESRQTDPATGVPNARTEEALGPGGRPMLPVRPPAPEFRSPEDERAWYRQELRAAQQLEERTSGLVSKMRQDPDIDPQVLDTASKRSRLAKARVEEIEAKLESMRSEGPGDSVAPAPTEPR